MKTFSYTGALTERIMVNFLTDVVQEIGGTLLPCSYRSNSVRHTPGTQIKIGDSQARYDFGFIYAGRPCLVEFDGNYQGVGHYNNATTVCLDQRKDALAKEYGYELVRVPYWLQLDSTVFEHLFHFPIKSKIDFPQGFIAPHCPVPASFCKYGLDRFEKELLALPPTTQHEVLASLKFQSNAMKIPLDFVYDGALKEQCAIIQLTDPAYVNIMSHIK